MYKRLILFLLLSFIVYSLAAHATTIPNCTATETVTYLHSYVELGAVEGKTIDDLKLSDWSFPRFKQGNTLFLKNFYAKNVGNCNTHSADLNFELRRPDNGFSYFGPISVLSLSPNESCMIQWGGNPIHENNYTDSCANLSRYLLASDLNYVGQYSISLKDKLTHTSYHLSSMKYDKPNNIVYITGLGYFEVCDRDVCQSLEYQKNLINEIDKLISQGNTTFIITIIITGLIALVGIASEILVAKWISERQIKKAEERDVRRTHDLVTALIKELNLIVSHINLLHIGKAEFVSKKPAIFWYDFPFYTMENVFTESVIKDKELSSRLYDIYSILKTNQNLLQHTRTKIPDKDIQKINKSVIKNTKVYLRTLKGLIKSLEDYNERQKW